MVYDCPCSPRIGIVEAHPLKPRIGPPPCFRYKMTRAVVDYRIEFVRLAVSLNFMHQFKLRFQARLSQRLRLPPPAFPCSFPHLSPLLHKLSLQYKKVMGNAVICKDHFLVTLLGLRLGFFSPAPPTCICCFFHHCIFALAAVLGAVVLLHVSQPSHIAPSLSASRQRDMQCHRGLHPLQSTSELAVGSAWFDFALLTEHSHEIIVPYSISGIGCIRRERHVVAELF